MIHVRRNVVVGLTAGVGVQFPGTVYGLRVAPPRAVNGTIKVAMPVTLVPLGERKQQMEAVELGVDDGWLWFGAGLRGGFRLERQNGVVGSTTVDVWWADSPTDYVEPTPPPSVQGEVLYDSSWSAAANGNGAGTISAVVLTRDKRLVVVAVHLNSLLSPRIMTLWFQGRQVSEFSYQWPETIEMQPGPGDGLVVIGAGAPPAGGLVVKSLPVPLSDNLVVRLDSGADMAVASLSVWGQ